jgi:cytosine/adenosine deaminase-related metal-dependent hydrolase
MSTTDERLADALEELALLRGGKPFHTHVDLKTGQTKRCSSPYCRDLTFEGIQEGPQHA